MLEVAFAIPGDYQQLTGGYGYARSVMAAAPELGFRLPRIQLPEGFPFPSDDALLETERLLSSLPPDQPILADGLAFGAVPAEMLRRLQRCWIALCHHPLALETGLSSDDAARLRSSEISALAEARRVVVTSNATATLLMSEFGVPVDKLVVAPPGVTRRPRAVANNRTPTLLAVGSLVPRKGYPILIEALAMIKDLDWRCQIVGALDRDQKTTASVRTAIERAGIAERVTLSGAIADTALDEAYAQADLFVHPAYFEGYGMAVADALAAGLPIVAADALATAALVPKSAGFLFPSGNPDALAAKLALVLDDPALRQSLAAGSWAAGQSLQDWPDTAAIILSACSEART